MVLLHETNDRNDGDAYQEGKNLTVVVDTPPFNSPGQRIVHLFCGGAHFCFNTFVAWDWLEGTEAGICSYA
jgi:hypothetical protein